MQILVQDFCWANRKVQHLKFGFSDSLSEITLLFDLNLYLDRSLAQQKAKSKGKWPIVSGEC